jgi:Ala-tRNA(Pro) deacylase
MGTPAASPGLPGRCMICVSAKEPCHAHSETPGVLDGHDIKYVVISHSVAYTAQGIAALTHISAKELAKTVIVKIDGELAMALLPASLHFDLAELRSAAGANNVALASEGDFRERFPDCETGAMPPFGNLYDMPVFADESLARDKEIAFNAGSHPELVGTAQGFHRFLCFRPGRRPTVSG